ncbi:hypothetical protein [Jeotgalibacillus haloalkalitolerans]|uniref:hypothetical protein n=1 Tax=Jeotgalibacillus haloalkalitolerans TaxID=3104292 RepID=UPI002ACC1ACF|nr:hypothetical protein [Jeotgalibacillus sp. HH7-29]
MREGAVRYSEGNGRLLYMCYGIILMCKKQPVLTKDYNDIQIDPISIKTDHNIAEKFSLSFLITQDGCSCDFFHSYSHQPYDRALRIKLSLMIHEIYLQQKPIGIYYKNFEGDYSTAKMIFTKSQEVYHVDEELSFLKEEQVFYFVAAPVDV